VARRRSLPGRRSHRIALAHRTGVQDRSCSRPFLVERTETERRELSGPGGWRLPFASRQHALRPNTAPRFGRRCGRWWSGDIGRAACVKRVVAGSLRGSRKSGTHFQTWWYPDSVAHAIEKCFSVAGPLFKRAPLCKRRTRSKVERVRSGRCVAATSRRLVS
jgi:hypothetical protein